MHEVKRKGEKVVSDFERLIVTGDVKKITPGLYYALTMHGGFIAHFDIHGFRATFAGNLGALIDGEMYPLTDEWRWDNAQHLESSIYTDGMTAGDVMRGISRLARHREASIRQREAVQRQCDEIALAQQLADKHGLTLTA